MVKKLKQAQERERQPDDALRVGARQIWQAGLGALAKARQEGGAVFEAVEEGGGPRKRPGQTENKLEHIFEERVARALDRIGALERQVAQLSARLACLADVAPAGAAPARTRAKAPVKRAAGEKARANDAAPAKATRVKGAAAGKTRGPAADGVGD